MSISVISNFEYDGGLKESKATNTQPKNYCIRAKDMNDISNALNVLIDTINIHEKQIYNLNFPPVVKAIQLNGLTYLPTDGLIDLGNITAGENIGINNITVNGSTSGVIINGNTANITIDIPELPTINGNIISGEISGNIKSVITDTVILSKETATSGTTLAWTIDGKTNSINIEKEKWLSDVKYNSTNKTIDFTVTNGNTFEIPVSEFINSNDFSLNDLNEKSYNSLDNIPTISGQPITGEISGLINQLVKNNSQDDETITKPQIIVSILENNEIVYEKGNLKNARIASVLASDNSELSIQTTRVARSYVL